MFEMHPKNVQVRSLSAIAILMGKSGSDEEVRILLLNSDLIEESEIGARRCLTIHANQKKFKSSRFYSLQLFPFDFVMLKGVST